MAFSFAINAQGYESKENNDHLSMALSFNKDSTLLVKATYTISEIMDDDVSFLLNPEYKLINIKANGLIGYVLEMKKDRPFPFYKLNFETEKRQKAAVKIYFEYLIDLKASNHIASNWLEFNVDKLWYPNYRDIDNKFTWAVKIENLYEHYSLVTYTFDDKIKCKTLMNPSSTLHIEQNEPVIEVYLLMAKDMKLWANNSGESKLDINFFVHDNTSDSLLISMNEKLSNTINFFNNKFDKSDKIERYLVVLRNTNDITFLQSRGEILLGNQNSDSYAALAHEVGHYWWSYADFTKEPWLNESFANYSMFLALDEFDKETLNKQIQRSKNKSKDAGSLKKAELFPNSNFNTYYHKGSIMLLELEQKIGRDAFLKLLSTRISKKINTTPGFFMLLEEQEGKEVLNDLELKFQN